MNIGLDLDGTLLASFERHHIVLSSIAPQIDEHLGDNWKESLWLAKRNGESTYSFLTSHEIDSANEIAMRWAEQIENPKHLTKDRLFPDAIDFLKELARSNHLFLVTARQRETTFLDHLPNVEEFLQCFEKILVVRPGKGAGSRKADACSNLDLQLVIGDTETDEEWAQCIGCKFIPVSWGFRGTAFWAERNRHAASNFDELLHAIKSKEYFLDK